MESGANGCLTFFSLELDNGSNGAEYFLLNDLHIGFTFRENHGLDEIPLFSVSSSAGADLGAVFLPRLRTPGGKPASLIRPASFKAARGVTSQAGGYV